MNYLTSNIFIIFIGCQILLFRETTRRQETSRRHRSQADLLPPNVVPRSRHRLPELLPEPEAVSPRSLSDVFPHRTRSVVLSGRLRSRSQALRQGGGSHRSQDSDRETAHRSLRQHRRLLAFGRRKSSGSSRRFHFDGICSSKFERCRKNRFSQSLRSFVTGDSELHFLFFEHLNICVIKGQTDFASNLTVSF